MQEKQRPKIYGTKTYFHQFRMYAEKQPQVNNSFRIDFTPS